LAYHAAVAENSGIHNPLSGGSDPLHLQWHCGGAIGEPPEANLLVRTDPHKGRAVLMSDSMNGWYRSLAELGADLAPLSDRSWRVDVVVRPVGCLGTFRRSRDTGLWFSGLHSVHLMGV
jgi:hypothetical protein